MSELEKILSLVEQLELELVEEGKIEEGEYESRLIAPHYSITTISINGSDPVDFQGGDSSESIFGNEADNRIAGGPGMDIITGLSGRDTFIYSSLSDSLLLDPLTKQMSVDYITDYEIGNDIIKGPNRVESG